ncbi:MAG: hypothetical protein ACYDBB_03620 [Armatimonadota bacterium]
MRSLCLLTLLSVFLAVAMPTTAQMALPGPELPKLSNLAFGWVSMSGVDPTLGMLTSFAPAMIVVQDNGLHTAGEAVVGQFNFGDFNVTSNFESAITSYGPGLLRISHYGYKSNTQEIPGLGLPGILVNTGGDAIEVSYAQHVGKKGTIGVSWVPQDSSRIGLQSDGLNLIRGDTSTNFGARIGGILAVSPSVKLGADFSYQEDTATIRYNPLLFDDGADPDPANWIAVDGDFITRCGTIGGSWQVTPRTLVYGSLQEILATGEDDYRRVATLRWFGVQQNLTKNFAVRANYLGGGGNFSVQWVTKFGIINAAYTHRALLNARDVLGVGNSAFVGYAMGF